MTMTHGPDSSSRNPSAGPVRRSLAPAIAPRPARPARRILGVPLSPGMITGALCLFLASTVLPFLAGYLAPAHGGGLLPLPADPSVSIGPRSVDTATVTYRADQLAYVNTLISGMSLDEEIGQMLVTDFLGTDVGPELETKIKQYHIGSAILYGRNFYSTESMRTLSQHMQADSKLPMFIMLDQEGGTVNRLGALEGYRPSAEAMGAKNDPAYVRQLGEQDGKLMASIGINVNLAPVVDVQGIPDGQTYMSYRMFGWTPDKVTLNAGAYLDGEQSGMQVVGTLKHFPGLGSVSSDPHAAAAVNNHTLDQLNQIDWAPYRALFAMGRVDLIMTSHILVPAVDPSRPTTISQPVTTGILRQKLGFNGVIITDDIYMQSLSAYYSFAQRVTGAVLAGNDLIASVFTLDATAAAERIIHDDVTAGTITKERIDESVRRILLLKLRYGVIKMPVKPAA